MTNLSDRPQEASVPDTSPDGIDRRRFLSHVAWAGTAMVFTASSGVLTACSASSTTPKAAAASDLTFVQISDTHIGFTGPANPDVAQSTTEAIAQINALATPPAFVIHTGDLTHTSTPAQFDTISQLLGTIKAPKVIAIAGEHDSTDDNGEKFRQRFGAGTQGDGWSSFDTNGIHFLALVNTLNIDKLGHLGAAQLAFIKADLAKLSSDTPLVLFSHIPLFAMYEAWGWGTDDALTALSYTKRFASVTAINGHVHQLMTKTEGNVTFYAGRGTAYPLPAPGADGAPAAKPLTVPAEQLHGALGIRTVSYVAQTKQTAITEQVLQ
jgi:3',5'-cyclic AMP phosphodiesterase CpdA